MTNETYETDEAPVAPESTSDRLVAATPWWFVSFLVHAAVLMMLVFIIAIAEQPPADEVVVVTPPRKPPVEPEIEPPQNVVKHPSPVRTTKEIDEIFPREDDTPPETPDNSDYKEVKGEEQNSTLRFTGPNANDAIGSKGGAGGPFGPRNGLGGKKLGGGGGDGPGRVEKDPDLAVLLALRWLSRHQNDDGSWSMKTHVRHCGRVARFAGSTCTPDGLHASTNHAGEHNYDVGISGLSLLAFLGAGYTHASKRDVYDGICFGDVVKNGTSFLLRQQDADGCVGSRDVKEYMYNHAIGALALCEAFGQSGASKLKEPAQKAIDFLMSSQNPGKGWRYTHQMGVNDSSVTGWAVMALKSADLAGLTFDKGVAYDGARAWLNFATFKVGGGGTGMLYKTGYEAPIDAYVAITGVNDTYSDHPAMTAVALMSRIFMDKKKTAEVHGGAEAVFNDLPRWEPQSLDYYYWYYGSLALYQFDGPTGPKWRAWSGKMIDALVDHQNLGKASDKEGSWEPVDRWSCRGGRVYATAINALTLETAYRYSSVFGGGKGE